MRNLIAISLVAGLFTVSACGSSASQTNDMSKLKDSSVSNDDSGGGDDGGAVVVSTVAQMRQAGPGNYQLGDVVAIARTPSKGAPKLVVQDAAGGDFSAMLLQCPASGNHACTQQDAIKALTLPSKVTVTGLYIKSSAATGGSESFYVATITDNGAGTAPAPAELALADLERSTWATTTTMKPKAYQRVNVALGAGGLKFYDMSPPECVGTDQTSKCSWPYMGCFGMWPGTPAGTNICVNKTAQPASTGIDGTEILISTIFYDNFTISPDCQCAKTQTMPSATSTLPTLSGILIREVIFGTSTVYFLVAPQTSADAPITNTIPHPAA